MTKKEMALSLLKGVRTLLEDPVNWAQGVNARNAKGEKCSPYSNRAESWCLNGALYRIGRLREANGQDCSGGMAEANDVLGRHCWEVLKSFGEEGSLETYPYRTSSAASEQCSNSNKLVELNDSGTAGHLGVLAALDAAIAELESPPKINFDLRLIHRL